MHLRRGATTVLFVTMLAVPASAAATGWYLMMASSLQELDAPLHQWRVVESFDTAKECEAAKAREIKEGEKRKADAMKWPGSSALKDDQIASAQRYMRIANEALCIATDDPRLGPRARR